MSSRREAAALSGVPNRRDSEKRAQRNRARNWHFTSGREIEKKAFDRKLPTASPLGTRFHEKASRSIFRQVRLDHAEHKKLFRKGVVKGDALFVRALSSLVFPSVIHARRGGRGARLGVVLSSSLDVRLCLQCARRA